MSAWKELVQLGMEVWYDDLSRELITSGKLLQMINEDGLSGITSNPTIFENAFKNDPVYIEDINKLKLTKKTAEEIYDELLFKDIRLAAQAFEEIYDASEGELGYVSLELSPLLADDTQGTVNEVKRLVNDVGVENIMIKVPATEAGIFAIEELVSEGYNINVTLIFSVPQYEKVARAYIAGLKKRASKGLPINRIKGTASVFLSRVDTVVDKKLEEIAGSSQISSEERERILSLRGLASTVLGRLIYKKFLELFDSDDFEELEEKGAWVQKPLWASTGTKNPAYSEVKYVEEHVYPDTVVTVPGKTFEAFKHKEEVRLAPLNFEEVETINVELKELGIDLVAVGNELLEDGKKKFVDSYLNILKIIKDQM
jgi:transaldolase